MGKRVAVVGDLILDCYVWGKVTRISQEAPVPVVHAKRKTYSLGGASNVMRNITSLKGKVAAFGVVGDDENGKTLRSLMNENGIETEHLLVDTSGRLTIEKQRIMAGPQHLARVDYEDLTPVSSDIRSRIVCELTSMIVSDSVDAVIFEDYAKGLIDHELMTSIVGALREKNVFVALDPYPTHKLNIKGLSLMTPNRSEAYALAGMTASEESPHPTKDRSLHEVAAKIQAEWGPKMLLITLGADGMALFEKGKDMVHIPTRAKEVFDVTGAGDTVIAVFVMAALGGATGSEAAEISNQAAGIVVGRIGTASVTPSELLANFER